jgi:hypothetical protein
VNSALRLDKVSHYQLWDLGVRPSHQNKGVGTALLEAGKARAIKEGVPIYLEAYGKKGQEHKLEQYYGKSGFTPVCGTPVTSQRYFTSAIFNMPGWMKSNVAAAAKAATEQGLQTGPLPKAKPSVAASGAQKAITRSM